MPELSHEAQKYITVQFAHYCRTHMGNPRPPFEVYMAFLGHAKDRALYGEMKLAKAHRSELLKVAFREQAKIYGFEEMKRISNQTHEKGGDDGSH